jgi:hypothetical protein
VTRLTADFSNAPIRAAPAGERGFHRADDDPPGAFAECIARACVLIYAVHQGAVDVELLLGVCGVADPNRPAAA